MPLSTYSILLEPYVALTQVTMVADIENLSPDFNIGTADTVFYLCTRVVPGEQYIFRATDAILITAGGTDYIIVTEDDCIGNQIVAP